MTSVAKQRAVLFGVFRTALEVSASLHEHFGPGVMNMTEQQLEIEVKDYDARMKLRVHEDSLQHEVQLLERLRNGTQRWLRMLRR